ncbi:MAG: orange carotenoid protein N-terminal domain-containing protein [Chroococcales cyanobacterium]
MVQAPKQPETTTEKTKNIVNRFRSFGTDDQLALFYDIYKKMGDSITPAAPGAANTELTPRLLGEFLNLSNEKQLQIMRNIVERKDTEWSREYGALTANNQLVVWYGWAQEMGNNVVDIPLDYERSSELNNLLQQIEGLEFEEQITVLRQVATEMGFTNVKPIASQEETGKTPSL